VTTLALAVSFQGGLEAMNENVVTQPNGQWYLQYSLQKFDGITGQAYPAYNLGNILWTSLNSWYSGFGYNAVTTYPPMVVHTDGTIFIAYNPTSPGSNFGGAPVVAVIDPLTGLPKAIVGAGSAVGNLIVAGDGYVYLPYASFTSTFTGPPVDQCGPSVGKVYLNLLRMDTSGGSSSITMGQWNTWVANCLSGLYINPTGVSLITNADQGVVATWDLKTGVQSGETQIHASDTYYIATTSGTSEASQDTIPSPLYPVLQAQDGTFYGTDNNGNLDHFDHFGNVSWSVPGDPPQIATADDGVVGASGTTYDSNGNATGQFASPSESWTDNTYQLGSVEKTLSVPPGVATPPYSSFVGTNQSSNGTSPLCHNQSDQIVAQYGQYAVFDSFFALFFGNNMQKWPRFTPNCFEFTRSAQSANFSFSAISTGNTWALIKYPLVAPASVGYGLDDWLQIYQQDYGSNYGQTRTINSGYRTPAHNASLPYPGATSSRHILGDAIDFGSATHTLEELVDMNDAALAAEADFVEDPAKMTTYCANGHPKSGLPYPCAHADWRFHSKGEYAHGRSD
jgi:hypothetical protein